MRTGSLRRRLALVCLGVLLSTIVVFDVFLYTSLDSRLTAGLDQQLIDRAGLAKMLDGTLGAQQLANRLAGGGVEATVRHGRATYTGQPQAPPAAPGGAKPPAPPAPPRGTATDVRRHGSTVTLSQPLQGGTLVLTADRGQIDGDLQRLLALEVIGSLAILAAAAMAVLVLVRRAVAPLDEMTRVAAEIAAGTSGRRLNPTRTDTELGRMAGAFDGMLDSLEDAAAQARLSEERMREFLSDVSHELRTPVAGLMATAEMLLHEGVAADEDQERLLVLMVRQSQRARRLIEDLLTLTRLEHGDELAPVVCDLAQLAAEEAHRAQVLAPGMDIRVTEAPRCPVVADPDRISQVIGNLLDNARHATPDTGSITLALRRAGSSILLEVTDSGRGVPADERERIFERLVRLDPSRSRERFGGGLGLPIARTIARAHGGELVCADQVGGARFVLRLPAAPAPAPPALAAAPPSPAAAPPSPAAAPPSPARA